jgi:hypothetical protein
MSPELLRAIHMVDAQETAVVDTMLAAPEEAWDIVWDIAMKMAHDPGNPIVNTLGMLCIYGWNQARVKCAQRGEDNGVG